MLSTPVFDPWMLGASLYTPATRQDLLEISTSKYANLTSLIYCTEDAVREQDVPSAINNLAETLALLPPQGGPLKFIRARNPEVLSQLAKLDLTAITGFVLPKIHAGNLGDYMSILDSANLQHKPVMLTLETREALSEHSMLLLRDLIFAAGWQKRVLSLRIGGNDLMNTLGVRRAAGRTLYEGPLERVISMLLSVFKPYDLSLSSPVYEVYGDLSTLAREVQQDLEYGLCGKTIIHPTQLDTVIVGYQVLYSDLLEAQAILSQNAPAVFQMNGRMCEPATHFRWAKDIIRRAEYYGYSSSTANTALKF